MRSKRGAIWPLPMAVWSVCRATAALLGDAIALTVERGGRTFASGDRVMFLKNERSLVVKNGTLGTIEQVSAQTMTARLDGGRTVNFDLKDYAHVDHGYASTIHRAQGTKAGRGHVLATPGLDWHAEADATTVLVLRLRVHMTKAAELDRHRQARAHRCARGYEKCLFGDSLRPWMALGHRTRGNIAR